jgi:hypothetical protein
MWTRSWTRALRRCWGELTFRFVDITGLPPNGRSFLVVAGLVAFVLVLLVASAFLFGLPGYQALFVNHGFGPGWQCENIPKAQVCRRWPESPH